MGRTQEEILSIYLGGGVSNPLGKIRLQLCVLLFYAMSGCQSGEGPQDQGILGTWEVTRLFCKDCETRLFAEKGTLIEFEKDRVKNPLYENCAKGADYHLIRQTPSKQLIEQHAGAWPEALTSRLAATESVLYGFIVCQESNFMKIAVLSRDRALYFHESDAVFELNRK